MTIHMGMAKAGASEWEKQERKRIQNTSHILESIENTLRTTRDELQRHDRTDDRKVKRYATLTEMVLDDLSILKDAWDAAHENNKK